MANKANAYEHDEFCNDTALCRGTSEMERDCAVPEA